MRRKRVYTKAHASLRVVGSDLDPVDVTRALMIPPDHAHVRGEPRLTRYRTRRVMDYGTYAQGMWSMSTRGRIDSWRLSTHVEWLISEVEERAPAFKSLLVDGVTADIFCYSLGVSDRAPPIPRKLRARAEALGLSIGVDHYSEFTEEELEGLEAEEDLAEFRTTIRAFVDGAIDIVEFHDRVPPPDAIGELSPDLAEELAAYSDWIGGPFGETTDLIPRRSDWTYGVDREPYGWIDVPAYRVALRDALSSFWVAVEAPPDRRDHMSAAEQRLAIAMVAKDGGGAREVVEALLSRLLTASDEAYVVAEVANVLHDSRRSIISGAFTGRRQRRPFRVMLAVAEHGRTLEAGRVDLGDPSFNHETRDSAARRRLDERLRAGSAVEFAWTHTFRRGEAGWWALWPDTDARDEAPAGD